MTKLHDFKVCYRTGANVDVVDMKLGLEAITAREWRMVEEKLQEDMDAKNLKVMAITRLQDERPVGNRVKPPRKSNGYHVPDKRLGRFE